jgi:hypothetical protein
MPVVCNEDGEELDGLFVDAGPLDFLGLEPLDVGHGLVGPGAELHVAVNDIGRDVDELDVRRVDVLITNDRVLRVHDGMPPEEGACLMPSARTYASRMRDKIVPIRSLSIVSAIFIWGDRDGDRW